MLRGVSSGLAPLFLLSILASFHRTPRTFRLALLGAVAAAGLFGGEREASATPVLKTTQGCAAFNGSSDTGGLASGTGFNQSDIITLTVSGPGTFGLKDTTTNTVLISAATAGGTYIVPATTSDTFQVFNGSSARPVEGARVTVTWSCVPGTDTSTLQKSGTKAVATVSGQVISGQVDGAITDGFNNGGTTVTPGPNGLTFNFAAEPQRNSRVQEAYDALAYAAMPTKAVPQTLRDWRIWGDIRGTGWTISDPAGDQKGRQLNVTAGVSRILSSHLLVGVFGGYERFNFDVISLNGNLKGQGATIGTYGAYRFGFLRLDGMVGYTRLNYDATSGATVGSFHGDRWMFSTGLTGMHRFAAWVLEPSAKVFVLREMQNAWTDSGGTLQASRTFTAGRVSLGSRVIYTYEFASMLKASPYVGFYGDYRFSTDNALPVSGQQVGIKDGTTGRVTGGTLFTNAKGHTLSFNGELGGIGSNSYRIWTGNIRGTVPF